MLNEWFLNEIRMEYDNNDIVLWNCKLTKKIFGIVKIISQISTGKFRYFAGSTLWQDAVLFH